MRYRILVKIHIMDVFLESVDSRRAPVVWVLCVCVCVWELSSVLLHLFIYLTIIHGKLTNCQVLGRHEDTVQARNTQSLPLWASYYARETGTMPAFPHIPT